MSTRCRDMKPALGHLEAALEATCAALMTLQAARIGAAESTAEALVLEGQILGAIVSVRRAMSNLRAIHEVETSMLAFGFVLPNPESPTYAPRRHPRCVR